MGKELTERQMINIELAARAGNKKSAKMLKHHVPQQEQNGLQIAFNCECSDPACQERLLLTLEEYEKLHKNFARFIVAKGHVEPQVEKVAEDKNTLDVVNKFALSED